MATSQTFNDDLYGFFMNRKLSSGHQEQSRTSKSASSECSDEAPSVKAVAYGFLIRPLRNLYGAFDGIRYVATDLRQADALATAFSGRQLFLIEDDRQARRRKGSRRGSYKDSALEECNRHPLLVGVSSESLRNCRLLASSIRTPDTARQPGTTR